MTEPEHIESLTSPPVVGRFYVVPCLVPEEGLILPVIGPRHADPDHGIHACFEHHHADVRFIDDATLRVVVAQRAFREEGMGVGLAALVAPTDALAEFSVGNLVHRYPSSVPLRHLARQCQREIPEGLVPPWQKELESAYGGRYLAPGGLCPHRGAPLLSLPLRGGRRVCPLHGLCFNERGQQCPR